jgi:hypothetical protein
MARSAMVTTTASTIDSMRKMNHAARFAALGEGCVMPMVLMKAFEMKRRSFTLPYWMERLWEWYQDSRASS